MAPKAKYTKEEIADIALGIVAGHGIEALNARSLAEAMGTSTRPIFTAYKNMDELEHSVRRLAMEQFARYTVIEDNGVPAFKQVGVHMLAFAKEQPKLFRLLFMSERVHSLSFRQVFDTILGPSADKCIEYIMRDYGLSKEYAMELFRKVWIFTYGIGILISSNICRFTEQELSDMLTSEFKSTLMMIKSRAEEQGAEPADLPR